MDADRLKHLEFIQAAITRMANHSFLLKGWGATIIAALLALGSKDSERSLVYAGIVPVALFSILDAYYLCKERDFRCLYDLVREESTKVPPLSMTLPEGETQAQIFDTVGSFSIWGYWGALAFAAFLCAHFLIR